MAYLTVARTLADSPRYAVEEMEYEDRGRAHRITAIRCKRCGLRSYNDNDVAARYCGHCHTFHDDPIPI